MTGWKGGSVLYFGDHPYTDLADASLMHGWRTGAIIKELTVMFRSTSMFRYLINNFNMLLLVFYSQKFKRLTNLNLNGTLIGFKFYNS